jgi:hypothetical protein|tara:strand:+ start:410 stop:859 length:450 start_codon:yes stop_codon:yes gene_type:complete
MDKTPWEASGDFNQRFEYDPISKQIAIRYSQPVDALIRRNQHRRKVEDNSDRRRAGMLYEIADIPVGIVHKWKTELGVDINNRDHFPAVMQLIQSREYNAAVAVVDGNFLKAPVRTHFAGSRDSGAHPLGTNRAAGTVSAGGLIKGGNS